MEKVLRIYKVFRAILFTLIVSAGAIWLLAYILFSIPRIQNLIRTTAEYYASDYLKTEVEIGKVNIHPFNRVILQDVVVPTPEGVPCVEIGEVGAGINLWTLATKGRIEITFAEIMDLNGHIAQPKPDAPLNIQFIIDAFKPKEQKEPTPFDVCLRAAVIRRSAISFDKEWEPKKVAGTFDPNHIRVSNLRADVSLPVIRRDSVQVSLKRLALDEQSGLIINRISGNAGYGESGLQIKDFYIELPGTRLHPEDIFLSKEFLTKFDGPVRLAMHGSSITPADLSPFCAPLSRFVTPYNLALDVTGTKEHIDLDMLSLDGEGIAIAVKGSVDTPTSDRELAITNVDTKIKASGKLVGIVAEMTNQLMAKKLLSSVGDIDIELSGNYTSTRSDVAGTVQCAMGIIDMNVQGSKISKGYHVGGQLEAKGLDRLTSMLIPGTGLQFDAISANADLSISGKDFNGFVDLLLPRLTISGLTANNVDLSIDKQGSDASLILKTADGDIRINADLQAILDKAMPSLAGDIDLRGVIPYIIAGKPVEDLGGYSLGGTMSVDMTGNTPDNIEGYIDVHDASLIAPDNSRSLDIDRFIISLNRYDDSLRIIDVDSELLKGNIKGHFNFADLPKVFMAMASQVIPGWIGKTHEMPQTPQTFTMAFTVPANNTLPEFFNLPVRLLTPVDIFGDLDSAADYAEFSITTPYLQQGKNKLIRDISIKGSGSPAKLVADVSAIVPGKDCDIAVGLNAVGINDKIKADIKWKFDREKNYSGQVGLSAGMMKNPFTGAPQYNLEVLPSNFAVADTTWHIGTGHVNYSDKTLLVEGLKAWNARQHISISGGASESPNDSITVSIKNLDLDWLFNALAINFVTFGGRATGKVYAKDIFSGNPYAYTDSLNVQNLSYNGALLGDYARLSSRWLHDRKCVTIGADVQEEGRRTALVNGEIYVTRDSLSVGINADRVNAGFLLPFVKTFCSGIKGRASGNCRLFGTFHDVDLVGNLYADTLAMRVGFTNVWYGCSDSVYISPGRIEIPSTKVYDTAGHSGYFSGHLDHVFFREPKFEFLVRDCNEMLLMDTKGSDDLNWYGTIYGTGDGTIKGAPGWVNMNVDMATAGKSVFNFVLDNRRQAAEYDFLTFTDRSKAALPPERRDTVMDFIEMFRQRTSNAEGPKDIFSLDIRASITPEATLNLIMNPAAGDKIVAHGNGALQLQYNDTNDDIQMYGKYIITEGNYTFTLQDLIIKEFKIREGSSLAFNGNPENAILDLEALYRTTTNLSDLDKSFSTDRELNRTNVPVDAVLKLNGELEHPEIDFDIELPTLTADVVRKVKSIISTDDMMNRQILYLLALGRFYTPEYTGGESTGAEFASIASTTLSSQLGNILGQLTNVVSVAPSIRSDKGDFSDIEVDVALSSRLLNNRLLINGNFGYRDPSHSSSTFIGDFDIEYLLTRNGNFRLKAYNHFNDQNYYLKQSLTTQGVGVMWRHDFGKRPTIFKLPETKPDTISTSSAVTTE